MNIGVLYHQLKQSLRNIYHAEEADTIAALVLEHYTGLNRSRILLNKDIEVNGNDALHINEALRLLMQHKPLQYVLGEAWFYGLKFSVNESVLIPRPETEELVQEVINWLQKERGEDLQVLDIGTGSGCIPIAIKQQLPTVEVSTVEISESAIEIAMQNARSQNLLIHFIHANFLDVTVWQSLPVVDCIVSNPPYIPANEKSKLEKNVADWEPPVALFVPDNDALLFYRKIALFAKDHLQEKGKIFVECHQDFAEATKLLFESEGYEAEIKKDINGNERMLIAGRAIK